MPNDGKICSFDCLYCEAGYNAQGPGTTGLPSREKVYKDLEAKLKDMHRKDYPLDVITFSGNGEPTLHPEFPGIIQDVISLRNRYFRDAKVSVLTNATRIFDAEVTAALRLADNNILKLDSARDETMRLLDRPQDPTFTVEKVVDALHQFAGHGIIQTMMVRGEHDGQKIDNTTDEEVSALIEAYKKIEPREVMLYSIDRKTPEENLQKVEKEELERIAKRIREAGIPVQVN